MTFTTCNCGHSAEAHSHFRKGDDCAICGPSLCFRFDGLDSQLLDEVVTDELIESWFAIEAHGLTGTFV